MHYPLHNYVTCAQFSPTHQRFLAALAKVLEPKFYHEAIKDPKGSQVIAEEIQAPEHNNTLDNPRPSTRQKAH